LYRKSENYVHLPVMKKHVQKQLPLYIVRFIVGGLFLFSGFVKINDIQGFAYKLDEYWHVFETFFGLPYSIFGPHSISMAGTIGVFEVMLAINLIIGIAPAFTTSVLLGMILFFTFLTGFSAITKTVTDCGCFGDVLHLEPWQSFFKDIVLLGLIGYCFVLRDRIFAIGSDMTRNIIGFSVWILAPLYAWYCYSYLPVFDFLPYKVGADLKYNTTTRKSDGQFIAYNYERVKDVCGKDEFVGKVLLITIEDFQRAHPDQVKQAVVLGNEMTKQGFDVYLLTSSTSDVRNAFKQQYNIPFCMSVQDNTVMKSIVRSTIGFLVMKDGVVKGKWAFKSNPTAAAMTQVVN